MAEERVPALLVPSQPDPITSRVFSISEKPRKPARPTKPPRARKSNPKSFTLAEAFTYKQSRAQSTEDLQKALYAISYLMQYFCDIGNEDPNGFLINGLTFALDKIAHEVGDLFVWDDILRLGGDPRAIKKQREE